MTSFEQTSTTDTGQHGNPASSPGVDQSGHAVATREPAKGHRAGRIALVAAIILAVSSLALSVVLGVLGAPYVDRDGGGFSFDFQFGDPRPTVSALGLLSPIHGLVGTFVGLWIIVQSIVAIAADWGRRSGIIALVLAVVTPILSVVAFFVILSVGG